MGNEVTNALCSLPFTYGKHMSVILFCEICLRPSFKIRGFILVKLTAHQANVFTFHDIVF